MLLILLVIVAFVFVAVISALAVVASTVLVALWLFMALDWVRFKLRRSRHPRKVTIEAMSLASPAPPPPTWLGRICAPDLRDPHQRAPLARWVEDFSFGWRGYR